MGRKRNHRDLSDAQADDAPVRIERTVDADEEVHGFVVALSDDWVLLHREYDLRLDGWCALRLDTVRRVRRARNPTVIDGALAFWGQHVEDPHLDLTSTATVVRTAGERFPLIAVHEEERYPGECAIGRPLRVGPKKFDLQDVSPGASWEDEPRTFPLKQVTRIDLGDAYQTALFHLSGAPPEPTEPAVAH